MMKSMARATLAPTPVGRRDEFPLGFLAGQLAHFKEAPETPGPDLSKHVVFGFVSREVSFAETCVVVAERVGCRSP
jgi:hypothetical protein